MEFKQGAGKKVILSIVLLVIAAAITLYVWSNGSSTIKERTLMCWECGYYETVGVKKLRKMQQAQNERYLEQIAQTDPQRADQLREAMKRPMSPESMNRLMLPSWGTYQWPLSCPGCQQLQLRFAIKCPECGQVFPGIDENGTLSSKCPKCGSRR